MKTRDWNAIDSHFRSSAGPMRDRRLRRYDNRPNSRDLVEEFHEDIYICDFCDCETSSVRRIVVDQDYDRMQSEAKYACCECSDQKEGNRVNVEID